VDRATRRAFLLGLLRAGIATAGILGLYFVLPLDRLADVSIWVLLPVALVGFAVAVGFEVRGILRAPLPALRAIESLAREVPLFLVLFASCYFMISRANPDWFTEPLSRLDALYFAVTVFATVGFGDIAGVAPEARAAVTIQMAADLLVIGFGLRIITTAVRQSRRRDDRAPDGASAGPRTPVGP
jgi:hypothetical protein